MTLTRILDIELTKSEKLRADTLREMCDVYGYTYEVTSFDGEWHTEIIWSPERLTEEDLYDKEKMKNTQPITDKPE